MGITQRRFQGERETRHHGFVLALGGGGGRGLAHLGVLQALEEHMLRPSAIVGTSIGALFGAMFALEPNILRVQERVKSMLDSATFNRLELPTLPEAETVDHSWLSRLTAAARESVLYARAATSVSMAHPKTLTGIVRGLCQDMGFDDAQIPMFITAVHCPSGDVQIFSKGDLISAITASMAIPGVFEPVQIEGQQFVDGGVACELPTKEAKLIANCDQTIVAVDVGARPSADDSPKTVIGMLDWAIRIKSFYLRQYKTELADVLITPLTDHRRWLDFSHPDQEIECGYQATLKYIPELLKSRGH